LHWVLTVGRIPRCQERRAQCSACERLQTTGRTEGAEHAQR